VTLKSTVKNSGVRSAILIAGLATLLVTGCYIDNSVDTGEGYGFCIGDDKYESFLKARKAFADKTTYVLAPIDSVGFGPHRKMEFNDGDYDLIKSRDAWDFYFDLGYKDSLKLQFSNGILTNIHRYKQSIELP
jgi:hypothetical protein